MHCDWRGDDETYPDLYSLPGVRCSTPWTVAEGPRGRGAYPESGCSRCRLASATSAADAERDMIAPPSDLSPSDLPFSNRSGRRSRRRTSAGSRMGISTEGARSSSSATPTGPASIPCAKRSPPTGSVVTTSPTWPRPSCRRSCPAHLPRDGRGPCGGQENLRDSSSASVCEQACSSATRLRARQENQRPTKAPKNSSPAGSST
jgi:hypothetical protein